MLLTGSSYSTFQRAYCFCLQHHIQCCFTYLVYTVQVIVLRLTVTRFRYCSTSWSLWVWFPMGSYQPHHGPWVDSASNRNEYQGYFLGVKDCQCVGLTTLQPHVLYAIYWTLHAFGDSLHITSPSSCTDRVDYVTWTLCEWDKLRNLFCETGVLTTFPACTLDEVKLSTLKVQFVSLSAHCGNTENTFQHLWTIFLRILHQPTLRPLWAFSA
jgi:hypothetical protein